MLREARRPRILVAEDDAAILELVTVRLELAGYHVISARDGVAALERAVVGPFAAAVLDVNMPRLDGFGVLQAMRSEATLARVPVLMLTARNAPADVVRARESGADDYMAKPFDDQMLITRVARLVARGRADPPPPPLSPPAERPSPAAADQTDDAFLI